LVRSGKVRYIACSNFSGWHLMKSLSISEKYGWAKYVGHQVYYSLVGRDYEYELMPLALDQNVGALAWSPLGWAQLTGKIRRGQPLPQVKPRMAGPGSRRLSPPSCRRHRRGRTGNWQDVAQIALNWLLRKPTVSTLVIGARNQEQLMQNLGAEGWRLTPEQVAELDEASKSAVPYPYWHQRQSQNRNPVPPSVGQQTLVLAAGHTPAAV
jgi:aryl-alcohol dehydrogenase-like predicted oxidoreductase